MRIDARIAVAAACWSGVEPGWSAPSIASMSIAGRAFHAACETLRTASFERGAIRAARSTGASSMASTEVIVRASAMTMALVVPVGRVRGTSSTTIRCAAGGSAGTSRRTADGCGGGGLTCWVATRCAGAAGFGAGAATTGRGAGVGAPPGTSRSTRRTRPGRSPSVSRAYVSSSHARRLSPSASV